MNYYAVVTLIYGGYDALLRKSNVKKNRFFIWMLNETDQVIKSVSQIKRVNNLLSKIPRHCLDVIIEPLLYFSDISMRALSQSKGSIFRAHSGIRSTVCWKSGTQIRFYISGTLQTNFNVLNLFSYSLSNMSGLNYFWVDHVTLLFYDLHFEIG